MKRVHLFLIAVLLLTVLVGIWSLMEASSRVDVDSPGLSDGWGADGASSSSSPSDESLQAESAKADAQSRDATERMRLAAGASIKARLVQAGLPMAGLEIEVWWAPRWRASRLLDRIATTADGVFWIGSLEAGLYKLVPKEEGTGGETRRGKIPKGWHWSHVRVLALQDLDLGDWRIPRPSTLEGRVVDQEQRPLAGIRIFHAYKRGLSTPEFYRSIPLGEKWVPDSTLTDSDGRFHFDRLAPGTHGFLAESPIYMDYKVELEVEEDSVKQLGTWVLKKGEEIRGRVVDRSGRGVARALVSPDALFDGTFRRKAVLTEESGLFRLGGLDSSVTGLLVEAEGYATALANIDWSNKTPVDLILDKALFLLGRVDGTEGMKTVIRLECSGDQPLHVYSVLGEDLPVATDGSFRIAGLLPGKYSAVASTPGLGRTKRVEFEFKMGMGLLVLAVRKHHSLTVEVMDDRGKPVEGARLVRDPGIEDFPSLYKLKDRGLASKILGGWKGKELESPKTNAEGQASLLYPADQALAVAVDSPLHLPAGRAFSLGQVPERMRLVLSRAARVRGRVEGLKESQRRGSSVRFNPLPKPDNLRSVRSSAIDAQGCFQINQLAPGLYRVGISYFNMTWEKLAGEAREGVSPILGAGLDSRPLLEIDVAPGLGDEILLALPRLGSISGVVRDVDGPVEGVTVFAVSAGSKADPESMGVATSFDSPGAHSFNPYMITGKDGAYRFDYVNPGSWDLRARARGAVVATPPVRVEARKPAQHIQQDLALGSSSLHGRFHAPELTAKTREQLAVYLIRAEEAGGDPFYWHDYSLSQLSGFEMVKLGGAGKFSFAHLAKGQWVLRVVSGSTLLLQRWVEITGHQRIDLGNLRMPKKHVISLAIQLPSPSEAMKKEAEALGGSVVYGIWVRDLVQGQQRAIWRSTSSVVAGKNKLELAEGKYQVEIFESYGGYSFQGISGESTGKVHKIEVRADGSVHPAMIDFR